MGSKATSHKSVDELGDVPGKRSFRQYSRNTIKDIKDTIRIIRKLLNIIFSTAAISDCHPLAPEDFLHSKIRKYSIGTPPCCF